MKIRSGWGRNFMAKFSCGGALKDSEPDAKLTPATKMSGRPVESAKKLVKTAPTCSSQRARQETVDSSMSEKSDKKKEEWDMEITDADPGAKLDTAMITQPMKRGKRSARQRRENSAPWVQLLGFNFSKVARARRSDQGVGSKKMKRTRRGTKSRRLNSRRAKGKKNAGGDSDASNQSDPNTTPESKEQCGMDVDEPTVKQSGVPAGDISSEVKESNDASEISLEQTAALVNSTWADFVKIKGEVSDGLMTTTDVISLYEARENLIKLNPAIIPGLDLDDGAENFDTSTAESALASFRAVSVPDPCVEFAVKILKDETPLPAEPSEVGEFIRQMACAQKSTVAGTSQSAQGRKD